MFGHLEFYFGKYVRLECNPIPALISGSFQFHNRSVRIFDHRVFIRVVKQTQNAIALFAKLRIAICDFCDNCESSSEAIRKIFIKFLAKFSVFLFRNFRNCDLPEKQIVLFAKLRTPLKSQIALFARLRFHRNRNLQFRNFRNPFYNQY